MPTSMAACFAACFLLLLACAEGVDVGPLPRSANKDASPVVQGGGQGGVDSAASNSGGSSGSSGSNGAGAAGDAAGAAGDSPDATGAGDSTRADDMADEDGATGSSDVDASTIDVSTMLDAAVVDVGCTAEANDAFCARLGKDCGSLAGNDNCGAARVASCGNCTATRTCGGSGMQNVCGAPLSLVSGGIVSSSQPGFSPEDMAKAFDGNTSTKWYAGNGVKTGFLAYQFTNNAKHTVTTYALTSANDVPGRDPAAWQLQGSNDGSTWTAVDARSGQTFAARFQTNTYVSMQPGSYSRYRLNITANAGGADLQLAELQLLGF